MARAQRPRTGSLFEVEEPPRPAPRPARAAGAAWAPTALTGARLFAEVALNKPLAGTFTYAVPDALVEGLVAGVRVAVPFGSRREVGVVVSTATEAPDLEGGRLRALCDVLDAEPVVGAELLELTRWMSVEYACSWGEALAAVLPAALKRERGTRQVLVIRAVEGVGAAELEQLAEKFPKQHRLLRTLLDIEGAIELRDLLRRLNLGESPARTLARKGWVQIEKVAASCGLAWSERDDRQRPEQLMPAQERAIEALAAPLAARMPATFLLQGVTGSGKTEVYLRLIELARQAGRGAIAVVPEIALTPQTVGWFRSRFGEVAVMHSRMTDAQRFDTWKRVQSGEVRVVVGARSALFAPVADLGVIVVDEEHEPSFKQGSTPRYHARDLAVRRAQLARAVCVLGSATPSLESWIQAHAGRYGHLRLDERVSGRPLPPVEIADMRSERTRKGLGGIFSERLATHLEAALAAGRQSILFLNRRGYAPVLWCSACHTTLRCVQCDVGYTLHRRIRRLVCHACCEEIAVPRSCPTCSAPGLRQVGVGAERVEAALSELLPTARVKRMDSDTMYRREDYEQTLDAFGRGDLDVLVGTQMIAKGLDFPGVTVVGIVSADSSLHLPDFRAAERTFQLIAQVAGRAGRGVDPGRIVVQTLLPDHPAVVRAAAHDFDGFAAGEVEARRDLGYPPHGRILRLVLEDPDERRVDDLARHVGERLRAELCAGEGASAGLTVLGPAPAPISMQRGRHRRHLLIKAAQDGPAFAAARDLARELAAERGRVRFAVDVDPVSML